MSVDAPAPLPQSAGALLAAERERQGLTRADMSQRLHLSVAHVEALEAGDFGRLAGGPFLKGFVRNYARALGMDPEPMASLVLRDAPSAARPALVVPSQGIRFDPVARRWSAGALRAGIAALGLLALGTGVLYWWLNVYPAAPPPVLLTAPAGAPAAELPGEAPPLPAEPSLAEPAPGLAQPPAPAPAAQAPRGLAQLRVLASERTWVEILDGAGERVASRHVEAGAQVEFLGLPPLRLAVGNAPVTRILFNGREVDLAPHTQAAVARLTLE